MDLNTREYNDVFPTAPMPQTSPQPVGQSPGVLEGYAGLIVIHDFSYQEALVDILRGSVAAVLVFAVGRTDAHPTVLIFRWHRHMAPSLVFVS